MYQLFDDKSRIGGARLESDSELTTTDFAAIAGALGQQPRLARKAGFISARMADRVVEIETRWNGTETMAIAEQGDFIAANLDQARQPLRDAEGQPNIYVIKADRFPELYQTDAGETEFGPVFRPRGVVKVKAVYLPGGFSILAPWKKVQTADAGYLLLNGSEVYGNNKETFEATYIME